MSSLVNPHLILDKDGPEENWAGAEESLVLKLPGLLWSWEVDQSHPE